MPVERVAEALDGIRETMTHTRPSSARPGTEPKITIMLAAPVLDRAAVGDALDQSGFTIDLLEVATANDALEGVSEGRFDCVILGENLPDEGGEAVLSQLHGHGIETPVIFVLSKPPVPDARSTCSARALSNASTRLI